MKKEQRGSKTPEKALGIHGCKKNFPKYFDFFSLLAGSETGPGTKTRSVAQAVKSEKKAQKNVTKSTLIKGEVGVVGPGRTGPGRSPFGFFTYF